MWEWKYGVLHCRQTLSKWLLAMKSCRSVGSDYEIEKYILDTGLTLKSLN